MEISHILSWYLHIIIITIASDLIWFDGRSSPLCHMSVRKVIKHHLSFKLCENLQIKENSLIARWQEKALRDIIASINWGSNLCKWLPFCLHTHWKIAKPIHFLQSKDVQYQISIWKKIDKLLLSNFWEDIFSDVTRP